MSYERIVVATDFSDASISAAKWASRHFAPGTEVILTHAVELPRRPLFALRSLPPDDTIREAVVDHATTRLAALAGELSAESVRREIRHGAPADVVQQVVTELGADLVVIGPHGDRPRTRNFLGSVADRIVRTAPVSVLVATQPKQHPPARVLVPVDDSDDTPTVLRRTRQLVDTWNARVTLLHVWSNALYSYVASISHAQARDEAKARREIQESIDEEARRWLATLAQTGFQSDRVEVEITHGNAGEETLAFAEKTQPDLIVLGRRGSGLVAPAVMGSTVGTVLHGARCPILVVCEERANTG